MPIPTPAAHQNLFARVLDRVHAAIETLAASGDLPAGLDASRVVVEPPRDPSHGDMATNAAMVLAKDAGKKPRELADALAAVLADDPLIESVAVAGPGFINLTLKRDAWLDELRAAISGGTEYGRSDFGSAKPVNVEYVSANPDRADACRPLPRRRVRRCARQPAGLHRPRRHPRVLHQRCRRAGRRARALGVPALSRGAGRGHRRDSRRALSGRLPQARRRGAGGGVRAARSSSRRKRNGCRSSATRRSR